MRSGRSCEDDIVEVAKVSPTKPKGFTGNPLDAITVYGVPNIALRNCQPQSCADMSIGRSQNGKQAIRGFMRFAKYPLIIPTCQKAVTAGKVKALGGQSVAVRRSVACGLWRVVH